MERGLARVTFRRRHRDVVVEVPFGTILLDAALGAGLPLASSCGGEGACKACLVQVLGGAEHLSPPTQREHDALATACCAADERLACAARVSGEVTVTTSYW
jgi:ferredoxin, 2Fe-2S